MKLSLIFLSEGCINVLVDLLAVLLTPANSFSEMSLTPEIFGFLKIKITTVNAQRITS